ncbi:MAG: GIY-YIG nuclease family protein [Pseudomonadota bacterium]
MSQLLGLAVSNLPSSIKVYRHLKERREGREVTSIEDMITNQTILDYQAIQSKDVLGRGYVCFCVEEAIGTTRLIGVWRVNGFHHRGAQEKLGGKHPFRSILSASDHWYDLERIPAFDDLADRVVVRWPKFRTPHYWLIENSHLKRDFEVLELRSRGLARPFPGFSELRLTLVDLKKLYSGGDGGTGWREALRSTKGVYVISDLSSEGGLYIGSATGKDGIWGRWKDYADRTHGGNKLLSEGLDQGSLLSENLQFSILQTLDSLAKRKDGQALEAIWKKKLGPRATVLNLN